MSGDDMVFEEIRYREPVRMLRPDRDLRFSCLSYQAPAPSDLPVFVDHQTADAMERHALSDTTVELGGILLGKECVDETTNAPFVWITQALEAKHYANTQASFTYTHDSWEEITRERDRLFPDLDIVGWYHTHPSFGIFLSHHDLFIHQNFFAQPLQVAYVIDPIHQTRGFFQWRDKEMAQVEGFYLTANRGDRLALARFANELENLPGPQSQGGGLLSPRLEAELIKMLSRPAASQHVSTPADRLQSAMVFGMLGSFLGMLGLAAVLWLYQLSGQMQEQSDALKTLSQSVDQTLSNDRLALDAMLEKGGTENPQRFLERYERAAKSRDEARRQALAQQAINETLGTRNKELELTAQKLTDQLETARKKQAELETAVRETPELHRQVGALTEARDQLQSVLAVKSAVAETVEGKEVEEVLRKLNMFRTATYVLGMLSVVLAAAVGYLMTRPVVQPDAAAGSAKTRNHMIT